MRRFGRDKERRRGEGSGAVDIGHPRPSSSFHPSPLLPFQVAAMLAAALAEDATAFDYDGVYEEMQAARAGPAKAAAKAAAERK